MMKPRDRHWNSIIRQCILAVFGLVGIVTVCVFQMGIQFVNKLAETIDTDGMNIMIDALHQKIPRGPCQPMTRIIHQDVVRKAAFMESLKISVQIILGLTLLIMLILYCYFLKTRIVVINKTDELCDQQQFPINQPENTNGVIDTGKCVLPSYPENGVYVTSNAQPSPSGVGYESLKLTVICEPNYGVLGPATVMCVDGTWSNFFPHCVRTCKLEKHPSVRYHCLVYGSKTSYRLCNSYEPSGTIVRPVCNCPNPAVPLLNMKCINGSWNYVAICSSECGAVMSNGVNLIIDGKPTKRGELPWHVGVYQKTTIPYMQICGGTIVTNAAVISAAHCFCNFEGEHNPASMYAVAAGKIYRPWNSPRDANAQKSNVTGIIIAPRYQGGITNFQDDIALLSLETPVEFNSFIRPVCLDFDSNFDTNQLELGNLGKVGGWGLTVEKGNPSQTLKVAELPYVDIDQCIAASPACFRPYITSDKICAGYGNGPVPMCKGDSGSGLVFPAPERGTDRYYLRGIVSTAANNGKKCNNNMVITFTEVCKHIVFIKDHIQNILEQNELLNPA